MYLITGNGLRCHGAANAISDTNRRGWDEWMETWGCRTLFSGLGHSDPMLGAKYTLSLPHTSSFSYKLNFQSTGETWEESETVRCVLSWKDSLTFREKGKLCFLPHFSFSISDMSKNEGKKITLNYDMSHPYIFQCYEFRLHGLGSVLILKCFLE